VPIQKQQAIIQEEVSHQKREAGSGTHGVDAQVSFVESFLLGTVAAVISATAVFPMDKVKTRLQSSVGGSIFSTFRQIAAAEGITKLFRGLSPQLAMIGPVNAGQMAANDFVQRKFRAGQDRELLFSELLMAGMAAGVAEILLSNPQEVVKIRMQMQGSTGLPLASPIQVIRAIGLKGLYKGVGACVVRDLPFSMIFFTTYDLFKRKLADQNKDVSPHKLLGAGALSAAIGSAIVTPADVVKTRLQNGVYSYTSYSECVKHIFSQGGYSAFFRGLTSRILINAPMFGIQFMIFENLIKYFHPK